MGRDTYLHVFVGRKCTEEETAKILHQINESNLTDYADDAHIAELNEDKPFMKLDDYPVVLVFTPDGDEKWFVCEKLIGSFDIEYQEEPIELDRKNIQIQNGDHKLLMVAEIST